VSVCVCLSVIIFSELHARCSQNFFVHITYGRGSVLLWQRSDMLSTSGFMDDVIFAHNPRLLAVAAQLKCSAHSALGLAINCAVILAASQRMHRPIFQTLTITSQVAALGTATRQS